MQIGHGLPGVSENLFGGTGQVLVWDLLQGRSAPPFTAVLSCRLEAGGSVGRHVQQAHPEIVIGLTGHGEIRVNGRASPFGPGAVVHLPLGHTLEIVNGSNETPLGYLIVKAEAAA